MSIKYVFAALHTNAEAVRCMSFQDIERYHRNIMELSSVPGFLWTTLSSEKIQQAWKAFLYEHFVNTYFVDLFPDETHHLYHVDDLHIQNHPHIYDTISQHVKNGLCVDCSDCSLSKQRMIFEHIKDAFTPSLEVTHDLDVIFDVDDVIIFSNELRLHLYSTIARNYICHHNVDLDIKVLEDSFCRHFGDDNAILADSEYDIFPQQKYYGLYFPFHGNVQDYEQLILDDLLTCEYFFTDVSEENFHENYQYFMNMLYEHGSDTTRQEVLALYERVCEHTRLSYFEQNMNPNQVPDFS